MKRAPPRAARGDAFLHNSPYHGNSHAADHCDRRPGRSTSDGEPPLHGARQGPSGRTAATRCRRPTAAEAPRRLRRGRADLPVRAGPARLHRRRGHDPDVPAADPRPGASGGPTTSRWSARRGSASARVLALGEELGWDALEAFTRGVVRLQRATDGRGDPAPARRRDRGPQPRTTRSRRVPDGIPITVAVTVDRDEGAARDRPARQPRLPAVRAQPDRVDRAHGGDDRRLQRDRPRRAAERGQLPPARRSWSGRTASSACPRIPASCSVATTNLADRVANAVQRAARRAVRRRRAGRGRAEPAVGRRVISGTDPRHDGAAVHQPADPSGVTGGPAGPDADGWLTLGGIGDAGQPFRDSVEIDELPSRSGSSSSGSSPTARGPGASAARPPRTSSTDRSAPRWR